MADRSYAGNDAIGRIARLVLWILPADFRDRHARDLVQLHRDELRRKTGRMPWYGALVVAADLVRHGIGLRRERRLRRRGPNRGGRLMEALLQDVRFAIRTLIKRPTLTVIAVASLALGIGANATVFSMVHAFALRPLPYEEPERLVHLWGPERSRVSVPDFRDWREQSRTFSDMAGFNYTIETLTGGEFPEQIAGARVTANTFDLLGERPLLGRTFAEGEDRVGAEPVALVSEGFWRERFSGSPDALGETLEVEGTDYTIVGVVAAGFNFPIPSTVAWLPRRIDDPSFGRAQSLLQVVGRLAPDATRSRASREMNAIASRLAERHPESSPGRVGVELEELRDALNFASDVLGPVSALMMAAVTFVLLIACANVASLLLSRAARRERELAVRTAMGAGRGRLVRQLLTESLVLAVVGAGLGVLLAAWGTRTLTAALPGELYRVGEIGLQPGVLLYVGALTVLTALLFGIAPALRSSRDGLTASLKQGTAAGGTDRRGVRLQSVFVAVEMTLSIVLLVGTVLMLRTLVNLQSVDPGFASDRVMTMRMLLPTERYGDAEARDRFQRDLEEGVGALPGVSTAATVNHLPLNHETAGVEFRIAGEPPTSNPFEAIRRSVGPAYFSVMGIPLVEGRSFRDTDDREAPLRAVIDRTSAERFWAGREPVGSAIEIEGFDQPVEVIGVVGATRQVDLAHAPEPIVYLSQRQLPGRYLRILARGPGEPTALAGSIRGVIAEIDPLLAVSEVRSLSQVVDDFLITQNLLANSLAVLALGALLLASIGVYGLMSFFVAQRTRDFGIHMALGATTGSVRKLILGRILRLSAFGVSVGLVAAWALGRAMSSMLYGVRGGDPLTLGGTALLLVSIAVVAGLVGARRATGVDPVTALRGE